MKTRLILAVVMAFTAQVALADCLLNGERVPDGTRNGAFVCQNGQWVPG